MRRRPSIGMLRGKDARVKSRAALAGLCVCRPLAVVGLALRAGWPLVRSGRDAQPYRYFRSRLGIVCAAIVLLCAGAVFAAGTGTLDRTSGWYEAGSNLTVTATATNYSYFTGWVGDTNGASISSNTISFTVTGPRSITAQFTPQLTASNSVPYQWLAQVLVITSGFETAVTNDHDEDGFTTGQEYWAGTDPTTNTSYLHISEVEMTTTNFRLIWAHSNIGAYQPKVVIQSRASLTAGGWTNAAVHSATNGNNSWGAPGQQKAFYRLCVTNVP